MSLTLQSPAHLLNMLYPFYPQSCSGSSSACGCPDSFVETTGAVEGSYGADVGNGEREGTADVKVDSVFDRHTVGVLVSTFAPILEGKADHGSRAVNDGVSVGMIVASVAEAIKASVSSWMEFEFPSVYAF